MPIRIADVVNWADIRDTVVVSLLAGAGLCSAYGFSGDVGQAAIYGLIGLAGLAIALGGIALGLILIAED